MRFSPKAFALLMLEISISLAILPTGKVSANDLPSKDEMTTGLNNTVNKLASSDDISVNFEDDKNRANFNSEWEVPILDAVSSNSNNKNRKPFFNSEWKVPIPNKFTCPNQSC